MCALSEYEVTEVCLRRLKYARDRSKVTEVSLGVGLGGYEVAEMGFK
jgi:hypothetical protein